MYLLLFFAVGLTAAYFLWFRKLLHERPAFQEFYARSDSFWSALGMKLSTIKTKLLSGLLIVADGLVLLHDAVAAIAPTIDWYPITSQLPGWAMPTALLVSGLLFYWLRKVTQREQAQVVEAVAQGVPPETAQLTVGAEATPQVQPSTWDDGGDGDG